MEIVHDERRWVISSARARARSGRCWWTEDAFEADVDALSDGKMS